MATNTVKFIISTCVLILALLLTGCPSVHMDPEPVPTPTPTTALEVTPTEQLLVEVEHEAVRYQLQIDGVELFPPTDEAVVRVIAFVNGTELTYPSIGGVEWLQVSPSMAGQTFRLPEAEHYEVRFEMIQREDEFDAQLLSLEILKFQDESAEGRYSLFGFDPASGIRSGKISAEVIYAFGLAE